MDHSPPLDPRVLAPMTPRQWFADVVYALEGGLLPLGRELRGSEPPSAESLRGHAELLRDRAGTWFGQVLGTKPQEGVEPRYYPDRVRGAMEDKLERMDRLVYEARELDAKSLLRRLEELYSDLDSLAQNVKMLQCMEIEPPGAAARRASEVAGRTGRMLQSDATS